MTKKNSKKEVIKPEVVTEKNQEEKKGLSSVFFLLLLLFGLLAFDYYNQVEDNKPIIVGSNNFTGNEIDLQGIKVVNNENDLKDLLKELSLQDGIDYDGYSSFGRAEMMIDDVAMVQSKSLGVANDVEESGSSSSRSSDFSKTNNQEENVDEADIVKTDGKYIYTLSQNRIVIVDVSPIENSKVIKTIKFDEENKVQNFLVNENKIIVFSNSYETEMRVSKYSFVPEEFYVSKSNLEVFEFDGKNLNSIENISTSGNYYDARMIGNYVYFISKEYSYSNNVVPYLYKNDIKVMPSVYYFDIMPYNSKVYNTITSINLNDLNEVN